VSAVVAVYNRERHLREALDSILGQHYRPLEIVVVDDGSTDGTARIARSYHAVRYLYQDNLGPAAARNAGVAAARGALLAFLDSDDVWTADKLSRQVGFLVANPSIGYCLSRMQEFGAERPAPEGQPRIASVPSALVVRREVFDGIGGFDPSYRVGEDVDWFFRAREACVAFAILPEVLLRRRIHAASVTAHTGWSAQPVPRIVKAALDRRRARGLLP
jgi:glycosyltransferase involved in cell wall biosynthesis